MKSISIILIFFSVILQSQNDPFDIELEPVSIDGLSGIQSYAFAQHDNKWILIGGRLDGLHLRQPWASFDVAGHNNQIIIVDPINSQVWKKDLSSLAVGLKEQLSSTNMNFYQDGDQLYIIGGYGYSESEGDHTTYPNLTAIEVSGLIDAIINDNDITPFFRQISDPQFQVTGGKLKKINDVYHFLGGQKFIGRYNPMGPDHGPGFIQEYTNQIRRFIIEDNGTDLVINHLESFTDGDQLHRRDYNAEAQILPNGDVAITMFSGVFQKDADLPYLNAVTVNENNYSVEENFSQYYNHYHCPVIPLYSTNKNEMHTLFFGGIAQYYENEGVLVQDDDVPFVKTISRVTRDSEGSMIEYKLPVEMPGFLGAGSEFIVNKNLPHFNNGVIDLDLISGDNELIGYIFGGINSSDKNIFFLNDGTQSTADNRIFKVYLNKSSLSSHIINSQSINTLQMQIYPNPSNGNLVVKYKLDKVMDVKIKITDLMGHTIDSVTIGNQKAGMHTYKHNLDGISPRSTLFVTVENAEESATQKIIFD